METVVSTKLVLNIPTAIEKSPAADLYKAAFESVFKFIESTGKLNEQNSEAVTEAINSHAQAIFMAKIGMKEGTLENVTTTGSLLYKALGLGTISEDDKKIVGSIQTEFEKSAEKIEAYKAIVDGFDAELVGRFSAVQDKATSLALLQVLSKLVEHTATKEPEEPYDLSTMMKRKAQIADAVFEAIGEVGSLLKLNPNADAGKLLSSSLEEAFKRDGRNIDSLTAKEHSSILETLKTKLNTKEQAEESHHQIQEFLQTYGKWLAMLFPVIAAPLAKIFSYIPIIGTPANALLGCISSNAPTILAVVGSSMLNGNGKQQPPAPNPRDAKLNRQTTLGS